MSTMETSRSFTCYFCNKLIRNESEAGHNSVCGSVLIACPNKCGSYVPRIDMYKHKKECVNRVSKSMVRLNSVSDLAENPAFNHHSLDRKAESSLYYKEMFMRLQDEVRHLGIKIAAYEQNRDSNSSKYQLQMYKDLQTQYKQDLEKLKYQQQFVYEWKKSIDLQLENFKHALDYFDNMKREKDAQMFNFQQKLMDFDKMRMDFNVLRDSFYKNQNFTTQANLEFANKMDEFKDMFEQENATIGALWSDQKVMIEDIKKDIEDIKKNLDEQKSKYSALVFDVKTTSQIASESAERIEIQERSFKQMKHDFEQMKLDLEILDELASNGNQDGHPASTPGAIIWKINDFEAKLQKSKENDTVLKSQIFFTHNFGYRIRVLVHLNGLKKWKDRYALISIHVLKGEFDGLLRWPCHIEGTITLRDQENLENPKNFGKYITAKRQEGDEDNEEPQESSSSYIFIPHSTLMKSNYLKNDTIYLDIRINSTKQAIETTL